MGFRRGVNMLVLQGNMKKGLVRARRPYHCLKPVVRDSYALFRLFNALVDCLTRLLRPIWLLRPIVFFQGE